jgi:hypothetical protein
MRKTPIVVVAALSILGGASIAQEPTSLTYDVVAVKHKLLLQAPDGEVRLQVGDAATSGDALRTGWRASADLEVAERATRFHVGSSTRFRLAHDSPGVLLEIERGRIRAVFGLGEDGEPVSGERLVTTPSAVLAVRGTEYGVEVDKNGDTSVVVFEGVVEVRDVGAVGDPVKVGPGQSSVIRSGRPASLPRPHGFSTRDWDRGRGVASTGRGSTQPSSQMGGQQGGSKSPGATGSSQGGGGSKRHGG